MTREDIIRMAMEAGFEADMFGRGIWDSSDFNRFAALVAAHERETCAVVAENEYTRQIVWYPKGSQYFIDPNRYGEITKNAADRCAEAIRKIGETQQ
jgi:hypothetical protein